MFHHRQIKTKRTKKSLFIISFALSLQAFVFAIPPTPAAAACATPNPPTTYGQVTQTVNVASAGTYRVWSRIKAPDTTNNSYYFKVDSDCPINVGDSSSITANTWKWVNYQDGTTSSTTGITLTAGSHTLVYIGREANVQLDRVLLLVDTSCIPDDASKGDNCAVVDSTGPTINLTAPTSGNTYMVGTTVNLAATATDSGSGMSKVEFYDGSTLIASDTTGSNFVGTWNTTGATVGTHSITARAYDNASPANITISSPAVSISITAAGTPGDANRDGRVNAVDMSLELSHYGTSFPNGDFNGDGTINDTDLATVRTKWTW